MQRPKGLWQSKEWKTKVVELRTTTCAQCGTTAGKMVLQHLWQPPSEQDIWREAKHDVLKQLIADGREIAFEQRPELASPQFIAEVCPNCDRTGFSTRKTMTPRYRCGHCTHTFDHPNRRFNPLHPIVVLLRKTHLNNQLLRIRETCQPEVEARVRTLKTEYHARYMSCKDAVTYCQKCAFLMDMKNKQLCANCKQHYHKIGYRQCFECSKKTELQLCERCKQNYHSRHQSLCYSCRRSWD